MCERERERERVVTTYVPWREEFEGNRRRRRRRKEERGNLETKQIGKPFSGRKDRIYKLEVQVELLKGNHSASKGLKVNLVAPTWLTDGENVRAKTLLAKVAGVVRPLAAAAAAPKQPSSVSCSC